MKIETLEFKNEGVYCIKNLITDELYIGHSKNLGNRKSKHFSLLKNNKHLNYKLQESVNKYGLEYFKFEILEYCKNCLKEKEQYYLNKYNPSFNITQDCIKNTPSLESRRKMSITRREKIRLGEIPIHCAKPVIQLSLEGEYINEYNSIAEASRILNIHKSSIRRVLQEKYKQTNGYIFIYK